MIRVIVIFSILMAVILIGDYIVNDGQFTILPELNG